MYQAFRVLAFCTFLGLSACGDDGLEQQELVEADALASPSHGDAPTAGNIGSVQYGFDPNALTRAEVQLAIPPDFEEKIWAIKLIPIERADRLGQTDCRYDSSDRTQPCTADLEDGLTMALLERPIGHYRRGLLDEGIEPGALRPDRVAETDGFAYLVRREPAAIVYRFFPAEDRTFLLSQHLEDRNEMRDPAIRQVLATLSLPN